MNQKKVFGLRTEGTIITFPISPTRILVLDDIHSEPNGRYYPLSKDGPGPINYTLWRNAEKFMVSPRHTDLVCMEMVEWANKFERVNKNI